jgi:hypothetical protein
MMIITMTIENANPVMMTEATTKDSLGDEQSRSLIRPSDFQCRPSPRSHLAPLPAAGPFSFRQQENGVPDSKLKQKSSCRQETLRSFLQSVLSKQGDTAMKKTLIALSLLAALPAGAALADDDDCSVPRNQWQPIEAARQVAQDKGWTVRKVEIEDGCYEVEGRDSSGRKMEAKFDPATLQLIEMEYEDDDDDRDGARNPAPAGTAKPPQNGLFGDGAAPKAQMK